MAFPFPTVQPTTIVRFHPLFFQAPTSADGEWLVGVERSDIAIALPEPGLFAIQRLQAGFPVARVKKGLHRRYGEDIDLADLLHVLSEVGLVQSINGRKIGKRVEIGQAWLELIPQAWVAWLFSPLALFIFGCIILAGPVLLLFDPALRPQPSDLLWSRSYLLDTFTILILAPFLVLKHEMSHLLAGRAKGLACALTFGHRLFYLVAVSHIASIWRLPRRERLLIYTAGMGSDCMMASLCLLTLLATNLHYIALPIEIMKLLELVALSEYMGILWEFQAFMKTDVYHILVDLTDQHDLPEQARALLLQIWRRTIATLAPGTSLTNEKIAQVPWFVTVYTLIVALGVGGSCIWFIFFLLPATTNAIYGEIQLLLMGLDTKNTLAALDGAVALASQAAYFIILGLAMLRSWLSHKATSTLI